MINGSSLSMPLPRLDALPWGAHRSFMLTDEALYDATGVRIAFTGRAGGSSEGAYSSLNCGSAVGDDPARVVSNRQRVLDAMGAPDAALAVPLQVHGTTVLQVDGALPPDTEADALLVAQPDVAALLCFADCLPLIIVAPSGAFAVVHCGWRGTVGRIASKAATMLASVDGCSPALLNAYIGPHIRQECFEVGDEVAERFETTFGPETVTIARDGAAKPHVSLSAAVMADLAMVGMDRAHMVDAGMCTFCESDRFYSYRASGGDCGRHCACAVKVDSPAIA